VGGEGSEHFNPQLHQIMIASDVHRLKLTPLGYYSGAYLLVEAAVECGGCRQHRSSGGGGVIDSQGSSRVVDSLRRSRVAMQSA
jgi:hypothetical protein